MDIQFIGADLGRGYCKGYTEYVGKINSCLFQSTVGEGRKTEDYSIYDNPMHLIINGEDCFVGEFAEKESFASINNFSDDKTSAVAQKLLFALLNEIAESETVNVCIGVPYKLFNKEMAKRVSDTYAGKQVTILNKITGGTKKITILKAIIFREADAALFQAVRECEKEERVKLQAKRLGMVTIGFRTSEFSFFDIGMKFTDKYSRSIEVGNRTVLDIIQNSLSKNGVSRDLSEIDNSKDYDDLKKAGYSNLIQKLDQEVEMTWINFKEMHIFIAGGTSLKFENIPDKFYTVDDPQMITARGLFYVAEKRG